MVAVNYYLFDEQPTTLCDWVRNFRNKRMQMKRKLRGNLRVSAMLTTALVSAEAELRRKQQERFDRWLKFQAKFENGYSSGKLLPVTVEDEARQCKQRESVNDLWRSELSDLDKFMRSISTSNCNNSNNNRTCTEESSSEIQNHSIYNKDRVCDSIISVAS